jgi:hypothetical protein
VDRLIIAAVLLVAALVAAQILRRRRHREAPSQSHWTAPTQLDRGDFARPEAPWLVAVFSSASCTSCAGVAAKAQVLASSEVEVDQVEVGARADLHRRYRIEAVPIVVVADAQGVVRSSFIGPMSATDLWAAVARLRDPDGSVDHHRCEGHGS